MALYVNGLAFGRVTAFRFSVDTPRRKMHTVDSTIPFEMGTTSTNVSGSMGLYRTALDGAAEGPGMASPLDTLPNERYFSMALVDLTTQVVIFQADHCSVENQSWAVDAKGLVMGNVSWSALSYRNEVRPLGSPQT